jgi:hypothetical protein
MKLSTAQVQRFWREWPKACKAMNWTRDAGLTAAAIDAKRKEFLLRCGFKSLTEVDRVDGFTKVLKELLVLQGTDLSAAREADDSTINQARVLRNTILTELAPCLELYVADVGGFMTEIMEDKNRWWKIDRPARGMTLLDLDAKPVFRTDRATGELKEFPSQLKQMIYTLSARLNDKRKEAGDTIHEMKVKANVPCACAICRGTRAPISAGDPELVPLASADPELGKLVGQESDVPF